MALDENGNLKPLMLSDLIRVAQETLSTHGDIPVGVETSVPNRDFNVEHKLPVIDLPEVGTPHWINTYWPNKFKYVFMLSGE